MIGCLDTPTEGEYWLMAIGQRTQRHRTRPDPQQGNRLRLPDVQLAAACHVPCHVELPLVYAGTGGRERRERAKEALRSVGLGDRMDHKPNELWAANASASPWLAPW